MEKLITLGMQIQQTLSDEERNSTHPLQIAGFDGYATLSPVLVQEYLSGSNGNAS